MIIMHNKKGISLPLETIVLLVLAAVVLAALLGFFRGVFGPTQTEVDLLQQQMNICTEIQQKGCNTPDAISAADKLLGPNPICKTDRPACSPTKLTPTNNKDDCTDNVQCCIKSCCIYCSHYTWQ